MINIMAKKDIKAKVDDFFVLEWKVGWLNYIFCGYKNVF